MSDRFAEIVEFIRSQYPAENPVLLHVPRFSGNEKKYLAECIDSTFVSYVGRFVADFEEHIKRFTGAGNAVAMVNGTAALQIALLVCGVKPGDEVITQPLTFVATANAIRHAGGEPVFVDVDRDTLGMSPQKLENFLREETAMKQDGCHNRSTGRRIAACVPMHTFGHPARIEEIVEICGRYGIVVVEDSAESLGSYYRGRHTGTFGKAGILSFNGNKPVTTGGGGMLITNDDAVAIRARHLTTTAKQKHPWAFYHDEIGYNLRMPNVNAAIGCAQMEKIDFILSNKRELADRYRSFFESMGIPFVSGLGDCRANYWLNAILFADSEEREAFLEYSNGNGIQTRPAWVLMNRLPMFAACMRGDLGNAGWLEDRLVNIPSSVRL